jgi:hypothetical protein
MASHGDVHASVSIVSAVRAVGNPMSITVRAITHEQSRSIAEDTKPNPFSFVCDGQ